MSTVKVSRSYRIVIPKAVRETLRIQPGQRVEVFSVGDRIELVPIRPITELRGALKGLIPTVDREEDRAL